MLPLHFSSLGFFLFILFLGNSEGQNNEIGILSKNSTQQPIVELLIVCDKEFTDGFGNDRQKLIDYWTIYMWDVNMKFKTVPNVDLSFEVTGLYTIQNTTDQPFIEQARFSNGSVNTQMAHIKFSQWLVTYESNFTNFDIAILVTGAEVGYPAKSWAYLEGACRKKTLYSPYHPSTLIIRSKATWGHYGSVLPRALGMLMGAPKVDTRDCKLDNYIMKLDVTGEGQHFFSKCSAAEIASLVTSEQGKCFWRGHDSTVDILNSTTRIVEPPSLNDQCVMITNNTSAVLEQNGDDPCLMAKCSVGNTNFTNLYPVENSPCGDGKFCFRGRCLPQGHILQNVASGLCLHSSNRFSPSDYPTLTKCTPVSSLLDKFIVLEMGTLGIVLVTSYSPIEKPENMDKYLSVDPDTGRLQFQKYKFENVDTFIWELTPVENTGEFLLFHPYSKTCATAAMSSAGDGSFATINVTCNQQDLGMRWKFSDLSPDAASNFFKGVQAAELNRVVEFNHESETVVRYHSWGFSFIFAVVGMVVGMLILHGYHRYWKHRTFRGHAITEDQYAVLFSN